MHGIRAVTKHSVTISVGATAWHNDHEIAGSVS